MMLPVVVTLLLSLASANGQEAATAPRWTVLPAAVAKVAVSQCSRSWPQFDGTWVVTSREVERLEADLPRLNGMTARGGHVSDAQSFYRQYVGIVVRGRRYIYINAFSPKILAYWPSQARKPDWRHEPFGGCDGGAAFWGALYDPETRRFSELAFNGVG